LGDLLMNNGSYRLPKTKIGQKTFDKIIRSGKKLFANNGFQATSINDIIAKARVAAGTFYIYFDNKLALYMYLLELYRHSIRAASANAIIGKSSRAEMERAGLKAFIMFVKNDPLAYKLIWESLFVDFTIFKEYYQGFSASYIYHLQKYVELGEVRNDIDIETVSYVLMGISNFVGLQILFRDDFSEPQIDFVVNEAMKMLESGLFIKKAS